jgi:hypothetical protein
MEGAPSFNDVSDTTFSVHFNGAVVTTQSKWNLVSLPLNIADRRVTSIFPTAISHLFGYEGTYVQKESLNVGTGYWLKFNSASPIILYGDSIHIDTISVKEGWNLIGSITPTIPVSSIVTEPADLLLSSFFEFSNGYNDVSTLESGKGYWIKARSAGKIILSAFAATQSKASTPNISDACNRLTITDAQGYSQSLYFAQNISALNPDRYGLPPLPPTGIFDARFASQRMVEIVNQEKETEFPIELHSAAYPITVSWDMLENNTSWSLISSGYNTVINGTGSMTILDREETGNLQLVFQQSFGIVPVQTMLLQNYPNPFNPQTQLRFTIGVEGFVSMKIFDATGREISTLVNEVMNAGSYTRTWNAAEQPSGVYLIQMTVNGIHYSRKIILIK